MKRNRGFTLIELLVVVAIVGILGAVAYPAYTDYVHTSRRADAKAAMMVVASALERHHSTNNTYADFPLPLDPSYQTAKHYKITPGDLGVLTYTITATGDAVAAGDGACGTLTLNQDHVGTPASCW